MRDGVRTRPIGIAYTVGVSCTESTYLRTPWRWSLLAGCVAWWALVLAPPFAGAYADLARLLLHAICHQIPERSFHLFGEPLAACHRCTGLYAGFTFGVLVWPWLPILAARLSANPRWIAVFFVPLLLDWAIVWNTPLTRFATGVVASFPVALLPLLALGERTADPMRPR
ncbi:MAG: DUF2085 domain-containing protein [Gammaproteobacteria bacterium]|nr:DUF2085 domain-containing protein [Gammaproteobacteria bacterium]MYK45427.1 DUF2085 domain-containing protein [Gammaproteobacteria bacterium]